MDVGVQWVDKLHRARGWSQCGYHYFVKRDGKVQRGRPVFIQGAHVKGHNEYTVAICYAGGVDENNKPEDNLTDKQRASIVKLVGNLRRVFGWMDLKGHNDFPNVRKACPSFNTVSKFGEEFCNGQE